MNFEKATKKNAFTTELTERTKKCNTENAKLTVASLCAFFCALCGEFVLNSSPFQALLVPGVDNRNL